MKRQKSVVGFTLVELIVVIVIIGLLGAAVVPRFAYRATNARVAAMNAVAEALNSTVKLVLFKYKAQGSLNSTSINVGGLSVAVTAGTGYPIGSPAGIGSALKNIAGFAPTYGETTVYDFAKAIPNCNVAYSASTGNIVVTSKGC